MYLNKYLKYKQKYLAMQQAAQQVEPQDIPQVELSGVLTTNLVDCWLDTAMYMIFGNHRVRHSIITKLTQQNHLELVQAIQDYLAQVDLNKDEEKKEVVANLKPLMPDDLKEFYSFEWNKGGLSVIVIRMVGIPIHTKRNFDQGVADSQIMAIQRLPSTESWDSIKEISHSGNTYKLVSFQLVTIGAAGRLGAYDHEIAFFLSNDKWKVVDNENPSGIVDAKMEPVPSYTQVDGLYTPYGVMNFATCSSLCLYYKE